jgi:hypothetical protein
LGDFLMSDDKWAEAWSMLTNALENAKEAGMTEGEVGDCIDDVYSAATYDNSQRSPKPLKKKGNANA